MTWLIQPTMSQKKGIVSWVAIEHLSVKIQVILKTIPKVDNRTLT